jgi:multidrug efflux pump subunit AcrB
MEKELGTAGELVAADLSGGFHNLKEGVYNFLGNLLSWLATHQGIALIIILGILAIIIWLILRAGKYAKQLDKKVSSANIEIGKKDTLIKEQKNKLEALQTKLADQQGVVTESLLSTLKTITGYDIDQLKVFFKFLTKIRGNPLQIADSQVSTASASQRLEEDNAGSVEQSDEPSEENGTEEKNTSADTGPEEAAEAHKKGEE